MLLGKGAKVESDVDKERLEAEAERLEMAFSMLISEVKYGVPGVRFSPTLRGELERVTPDVLRELIARKRDGCAALFVASQRGNVLMVEHLVHVWGADLEQRGQFEVAEDHSTHSATPLWVAAVCGRLDVVQLLADAGADINAASDSGSTPMRSACYMSQAHVVRVLVERGADARRPNYNGGTCLINAVQSPALCELLLDRGVDVNARDTQLKTALHYALQENRVDTARLLLDRGADPKLASRIGDDALRTACIRGSVEGVRLAAARGKYTAERLAEARELLGATLLAERGDERAALAEWAAATALRRAAGGLRKRGWSARAPGGEQARRALLDVREWASPRELAQLMRDPDALLMQALLVVTRVLGPHHKDAHSRIMKRGFALAETGRQEQCAAMWTWALTEQLRQHTALYGEAANAACALTALLEGARVDGWRPPHGAVLHAFGALAQFLPEGGRLLAARPQFRTQADCYDRMLRCATHLALALERAAGCPAELAAGRDALRALLAHEPRSATTGDSLLHLAVSRLNTVRSSYFPDFEVPGDQPLFPSLAAVRLLLACGARVSALNRARSTALHVSVIPFNFRAGIVEALLEHGAHLDQPNRFGDSAADLVVLNPKSRVAPLQHVTLRCLAAHAVVRAAPAPPPAALPRTLFPWLRLHSPLPPGAD